MSNHNCADWTKVDDTFVSNRKRKKYYVKILLVAYNDGNSLVILSNWL